MSSLIASNFSPVIKVQFAYFLMYYAFLMNQSFTRIAIKKKLRKEDKEKGKAPKGVSPLDMAYLRNDERLTSHPNVIRGDRTALNTLEQMGPFLASLWACAVFVSPATAAMAGWIYVLCRAIYPFVYFNAKLLLPISTAPCYVVIIYLQYQVLSAALA